MWRAAIKAHRYAPPDAGFSGRLQALSRCVRRVARLQGRPQGRVYLAGGQGRGRTAVGTPLRGRATRPREAMARLRRCPLATLKRAAADTDLAEVAGAFQALAVAAADLGEAIEAEDRASGLLPPSAAEGSFAYRLVGTAAAASSAPHRRSHPRSRAPPQRHASRVARSRAATDRVERRSGTHQT